MLITAGPTHEPIDAVRYIGNRSSGRLGVALADEAARRGHAVTLLLGPAAVEPAHAGIVTMRFRTTADLERLLGDEFPRCDVLIMAAAVADYRPIGGSEVGKIRRADGRRTIELESTPDLLAGCAVRRRAGQVIVGFALEPRDRLLESAAEKIRRKGIDAIVANPLETMDSAEIEAHFIVRDGASESAGRMHKRAFAAWLLDRVGDLSG
jgi:phosphopantothenoylcysteine decarboxylase/phosphopantothenate--cysteine ligase